MCLDYRMPFPLTCSRSAQGWLAFPESVLSATYPLTLDLRRCPPSPRRGCCFGMSNTFQSRDPVWPSALGNPSFHIEKSLKPEQTGLSQGPEMKGWQHPTWDDLSQWHPGPHVAWLLRTQVLRLPHTVSKSQPATQGVSSSRSWIPCGQTPKHCFLLMTQCGMEASLLVSLLYALWVASVNA